MVKKVKVPKRSGEDWDMDTKAYFLIRYKDDKIEVRIMEVQKEHLEGKFVKNQKPLADYFGKDPQDVYYKILNDDWVTKLQHAAYLGSELQKAYIAMKLGIDYVQDEELKIK